MESPKIGWESASDLLSTGGSTSLGQLPRDGEQPGSRHCSAGRGLEGWLSSENSTEIWLPPLAALRIAATLMPANSVDRGLERLRDLGLDDLPAAAPG